MSVALGAAVMASPALAQTGGGTDVRRPAGSAAVEMNKQEIKAPATAAAKPTTAERKSGKTSTQHKGGMGEKKGHHKGGKVEKKDG